MVHHFSATDVICEEHFHVDVIKMKILYIYNIILVCKLPSVVP